MGMNLRPGLRTKLLIILVVMSTVIILAMAMANRWAFNRGFVDYLASNELQRLGSVARGLEQAYADHGNWRFLKDNPHAWQVLLARFDRESGDLNAQAPARPPLPGGSGERGVGSFGGFSTGPRRISDEVSRLSERLRVIASDGSVLLGGSPRDAEKRIELRNEGALIGWLAVGTPASRADALDAAFVTQQLQASFWIAIGAIAFALLIGLTVAHVMFRRLTTLASGARSLASGRFDTRVPIDSEDELGQLSADFNRLAETLEKNEGLRRQGMADASHELRTPLAVLRAELEAMVDGIRPASQQRLGQLLERVNSLSRLVDDLFALAKADAGALDYRMDSVDLQVLLRDTVAAFEAAVEEEGLEIHAELEEQLWVWSDSERLRQVFQNLLKNSLRYTNRGGRISLAAYERDQQIHIDLMDSEPGVAPQHLEHLFDRFYRADASRSRRSGGTGLGLAICRNIIHAHGGEIEAQVSPLGGLWVKVILKQQQPDG